MDFKILELKFKNEIIELTKIDNFAGINSIRIISQFKDIDQLFDIEQNTNNDSLEPFPKNFDFIKIDLCSIPVNIHDIDRAARRIIGSLIPDDYVYVPGLSNISYKNKNTKHMYSVITNSFSDYSLRIICDNKTYTLELYDVCVFFVSRLPCFVHIDNIVLMELQKSYNVIPIKQIYNLYYLKPIGLLTKAAIKK
ncbi:hypothetical protein Hokovirus_2_11 [Hokovirus HKV1]|uniref:Uncharacterized protein n=1 Tax=Hokovirus HKV1 TaxID=1977638 RepID=A0A1V0SFR5_9VIRU|nr:hypothetical protein Hokovirus_2_11 [Hokovirus HKV1]